MLAAFHPTRSVGVDVERIRLDFEPTEISARMFPADVHAGWMARPRERRVPEFFRNWARHEARLKAAGLGLGGAGGRVGFAAWRNRRPLPAAGLRGRLCVVVKRETKVMFAGRAESSRRPGMRWARLPFFDCP